RGFLPLAAATAGQFDSRPLGEHAQRVEKLDAVALHDEINSVAAGLAAEAVKKLLGGIDAERGRLLLVERAQTDELGPAALESDALPDQFDDVRSLEDLRLVVACGAVRHYAKPHITRLSSLSKMWLQHDLWQGQAKTTTFCSFCPATDAICHFLAKLLTQTV